MTYTTEEAIAMAREVGVCTTGGDNGKWMDITPEELTALCNLVRQKTLEEAADYLDSVIHTSRSNDLRRMAKGE